MKRANLRGKLNTDEIEKFFVKCLQERRYNSGPNLIKLLGAYLGA